MIESDSNLLYRRIVDERVIRLRHEVMLEYEQLGFQIHTSSGFLHEATIEMAANIQGLVDDEQAKKIIRPIVRSWICRDR